MDKGFYPTVVVLIKLTLTAWSLYSLDSSICVAGELVFRAVNNL